ncbi:MAG: methyltransferase FkbM, partial [Mycobacterium sp.]|nr:methyltransferase FkbM [Mycobacterium sp.]
ASSSDGPILSVAAIPARRAVLTEAGSRLELLDTLPEKFEPGPAQAKDLTAMFDAAHAAVRVEAVALSAEAGTTAMRVLAAIPAGAPSTGQCADR